MRRLKWTVFFAETYTAEIEEESFLTEKRARNALAKLKEKYPNGYGYVSENVGRAWEP